MKLFGRVGILVLIVFVSVTPCWSGQTEQKSFIFEIDYKGVSSYVLGSIHMLKKEHYPLKKIFLDAFERSTVLAVEANLTDVDKFQLQSKIWEKAKYTGKKILKDVISDSLYKKTSEILSQFGMTMDFYNQFKPWFVAMYIQGLQLIKMGFNPDLGIDMYFLDKAKKRKMEVLELEGALFQIELLNGFSMDEQVDFLKVSALETKKMPEMVGEIIKFWDRGDMKEMENLLNEEHESVKNDESLKNKFLYDRNTSMVEKIISWIKDKRSYFIIAGAAHLTGEKGIINLLAEKGYKIRQL